MPQFRPLVICVGSGFESKEALNLTFHRLIRTELLRAGIYTAFPLDAVRRSLLVHAE